MNNNDGMLKIVDHLLKLRNAVMEQIVPQDAQQHFQTSQKELLLGVRSVLDHVIADMDECSKETGSSKDNSSQKIEII